MGPVDDAYAESGVFRYRPLASDSPAKTSFRLSWLFDPFKVFLSLSNPPCEVGG